MILLLINQDGKEIGYFTPEKFSVKLQPVGAVDEYEQTFCGVSIQSRPLPRPLAVGIYRSQQMAELVAKDLLQAAESGKTFYIMPPSSITPLELLERISAE